MAGKRQFGSIRKLPSGKYQARYPDAVGQLIPAPTTFATKADAGRYLDQIRTDQDRGAWIDPRAGHLTLTEYAWGWLALRPDLRPRTQELYEDFLRLHILPTLGAVELGTCRRLGSGLGTPRSSPPASQVGRPWRRPTGCSARSCGRRSRTS